MNTQDLDDIDLELLGAADELRDARSAKDAAIERAKQAALAALARGATESTVAHCLRVNRLTVRKWAGK
jgi:hypothetical protein